jgi:GNAT superfamily N-acetyltransferase
MILSAAPDREVDTSIVTDAGEDEASEMMRRWYGEDEPDPGAVDQLVEFSRREARACADRLLGIRSSNGQLVAISKLRSDGAVAQVEDVYTAPEARGRGFGRAVVTRAVQLARDAGHELIFIPADDNDWPKQLYARIGFRPLGRLWQFHLG